jgi:hypothetical protein
MTETPPTTAPAPGAPTPPAGPAVTPPTDPPADDDATTFTSDRQRRRFAELTGRVGVRERERDEARSRVDQLLTREAERVAAGSLSQPADIWLDGATVTDLLNDDGSAIDLDKVQALVDGLLAKRPGLQKPPPVRPLSGVHGVGAHIPEKATLADAVKRIAGGRGGL